MSLINQMLKDLEQRRQGEGPKTSLLQKVRVPSSKGRRRRALWWGAGLVLLGGAGYWGWISLPRDVLKAGTPAVPVALSVPANAPSLQTSPEPKTPAPAGEENPIVADTPLVTAPMAESASAATAPVPPPLVVVLPQEQRPTLRAESVAAAPPVAETKKIAAVSSQESSLAKVLRQPSVREQADALLRRGEAALVDGQSTEGVARLQQALAIDPRHFAVRERLVGWLLRSGRMSEAEALLREGVQLEPEHLPFRKGYARLLVERERLREGAGVLLSGTLPPLADDPDYYALLAAIYQRQQEFASAARIYRDLLAVRPGAGTWWLGLGIAQEGEGEIEAAVQSYRTALTKSDLQPDLQRFLQGRLQVLEP